ncbi:MAG: hypothetical protein VX583_03645 [Bdellovibrionota bacterium]|nr:hypothetical protein [Pseudobdellovibrionaceae bacterium]
MKLLMALIFLFAGAVQAQEGLGVLKFEYLDIDLQAQAQSAVQCTETKFSNRLYNREDAKDILIVEIIGETSFVMTYSWGPGKSYLCDVTNESELNRILKLQFDRLNTQSDDTFNATLFMLKKETSGLITHAKVEKETLQRMKKSVVDLYGKLQISSIKFFEENPYSQEEGHLNFGLRRMTEQQRRLGLIEKVAALIMMEYKIPTATYTVN